MTTALEFALFYSQQKWDIFPVKPHDKTPIVKWADEATSNFAQITEWWQKYPDANIGLATGKRSGLFALDVDAGHGGIETLQELTGKFGNFPKTPKSHTGGGGNHYLFQWHDGIRNSAGKLGKGLDTRGDGGYIVVPQSIHPNGGKYEWQVKPSNTPLAKAPHWLTRMLFSEVQPVPVERTDGVLTEGGRNNYLTKLAGAIRRKGSDVETIFVAINAENLNKCIPPLPEEEVRAIAESVSRYAPQDAPKTQDRDRATAEWSYCKAIYEAPDYIFVHPVTPKMFANKKLAEFVEMVQTGMGVAQAALNAEILSELEEYDNWMLTRLEGYASAIIELSRMAEYIDYADKIKLAATNRDSARIDLAVKEMNSLPPTTGHKIEVVSDVAEEVERQIIERAKNPVKVWGIPYAWERISEYTGGKQKGAVDLIAGEPKIGKSYWKLQDILYTSVYHNSPSFYWCGEMPRTQLMKRFYTLLGVNSRRMRTGEMTEEDWDALSDAKALILNSPIFIDDTRLELHEIRPLLKRMKDEHGIEEFAIDYASKVIAPGVNEIEQTSNVSRELKQICIDLDLAGTMIASVNKDAFDGGMAAKKNVRGSGQQIHDADVIYQMTRFPEKYGVDYGIMPDDYERCVAMNISAGRELEGHIEGGFIPYMKEQNSPKFRELSKSA